MIITVVCRLLCRYIALKMEYEIYVFPSKLGPTSVTSRSLYSRLIEQYASVLINLFIYFLVSLHQFQSSKAVDSIKFRAKKMKNFFGLPLGLNYL